MTPTPAIPTRHTILHILLPRVSSLMPCIEFSCHSRQGSLLRETSQDCLIVAGHFCSSGVVSTRVRAKACLLTHMEASLYLSITGVAFPESATLHTQSIPSCTEYNVIP